MKFLWLIIAALIVDVNTVFSQNRVDEETPFLPQGAYLSPDLPEFQVYGAPATEEDGQAVLALLQRFGQAWGSGDVDGAVASYSKDIEWTNAFGVIVKGSDALRQFFTWLFSHDPESSGGESESRNSRYVSLRYIGDHVAIYHGMTLSSRGTSRSGEGNRRNHVTFVLEKKDGEWKIAHQMIMDARDR